MFLKRKLDVEDQRTSVVSQVLGLAGSDGNWINVWTNVGGVDVISPAGKGICSLTCLPV